MSEMKDYENLSQKVAGLVVTAALSVVGLTIKAVQKSIEISVHKTNSEDNLHKENSRSTWGKLTHKKEREAAQREYDKYHK